MIETLEGVATARGGGVVFVQADHGDGPAIARLVQPDQRKNPPHFGIESASPLARD